jgi:histidinol dehydrogenase
LRPQQVVDYSESALAEVTSQLDIFAIAEGLSAHGDAAKIRFTGGN